jgi:hypothetical protein
MKRGIFFVALIALVAIIAVGQAEAYPNKAACTGCHSANAQVNVTVNFQGCNGSTATYSVSASGPFDGVEGWAVFNGNTNIANGTGASGSFSVAAGGTYMVYGVDDASGGKGGADSTSITPECGTACTDADTDGYAIEGGGCGPIDCDDTAAAINPGALEICNDVFDNDCDGKNNCQDANCSASPFCTPTCTKTAKSEKGKCTDGIDQDCDGKVDCADRDCARDAACLP